MHEIIVRIGAIATGLAPLDKEVYFIGGVVTSLYAENPAVYHHRATDDVDVLIEITSRGKYYALQEKLRSLGFVEDAESDVICRWKYQGITVDIMPLDEGVLGFTNKWYEEGIKHAEQRDIGGGQLINIFSYPYFLATKLEALNNRKTDWRYSKDFEDIIKTLDSVNLEKTKFHNLNPHLIAYLSNEIKGLFTNTRFLNEAIFCAIYPNNQQERIDEIIAKLESLQ